MRELMMILPCVCETWFGWTMPYIADCNMLPHIVTHCNTLHTERQIILCHTHLGRPRTHRRSRFGPVKFRYRDNIVLQTCLSAHSGSIGLILASPGCAYIFQFWFAFSSHPPLQYPMIINDLFMGTGL